MTLTKGRRYASFPVGRGMGIGIYLGRVPDGWVFQGSYWATDAGTLSGTVGELPFLLEIPGSIETEDQFYRWLEEVLPND